MTLYNLRTNPAEGLPFVITKFTSDLDVESSYPVGTSACECPAGHLPKCRHRTMLPNLRQRVNSAWFWDFKAEAWVDPTGEANKPAPASEDMIADEAEVGPSDNPYSDVVTDLALTDPELAPKAGSQASSGFRRRL